MIGNRWEIVELINNTDIPVDLKLHLRSLNINFIYQSENIVIMKNDYNIGERKLKKLKELIEKEIIDNDEDYKNLEDISEIKNIESHEFVISGCIDHEYESEEEFLNYLWSIGTVPEYDYEHNYYEKYEYPTVSRLLFHNIRSKYIAVFHNNSIDYGLAFIGYMIKDKKLYVNIKAFNYDVLVYLMEQLNKKYNEIYWENNLSWEFLLSRNVGKGFHPNESYLIDHPLSTSFLKTSKNSEFAESFKLIISKLLDKGHLTEKEFSDIPHKDATKYLHPYLVLDIEESGRFWFGQATGLVYSELNSTDPKKIKSIHNIQKVYAPHHDLLHYVRLFWHQHFIEEVMKIIKKRWEDERNNLRILDIIADYKFDFLSETIPIKESRDIDCLIRLKNISTRKEYIIAIEAKRNADEFNIVLKDNNTKISSTYAKEFSCFFMVSYINKTISTTDKDIIEWESGISRNLYSCVGHNFNSLVEDFTGKLVIACEEC
jgi:hypothetical protein